MRNQPSMQIVVTRFLDYKKTVIGWWLSKKIESSIFADLFDADDTTKRQVLRRGWEYRKYAAAVAATAKACYSCLKEETAPSSLYTSTFRWAKAEEEEMALKMRCRWERKRLPTSSRSIDRKGLLRVSISQMSSATSMLAFCSVVFSPQPTPGTQNDKCDSFLLDFIPV